MCNALWSTQQLFVCYSDAAAAGLEPVLPGVLVWSFGVSPAVLGCVAVEDNWAAPSWSSHSPFVHLLDMTRGSIGHCVESAALNTLHGFKIGLLLRAVTIYNDAVCVSQSSLFSMVLLHCVGIRKVAIVHYGSGLL